MSIRPRKKIDLKISQNKAYQIILNPLVTEKSTQQSEFNKTKFHFCTDFFGHWFCEGQPKLFRQKGE